MESALKFVQRLKKIYKHALYGLFLLLLGVVSCGKKGPPRLPVYEAPPMPSGLHAIHREEGIILKWSYPEKKDIIHGAVILRADDRDSFKELSFVEKNDSYSDKGFALGHIHRYKVIAKSIDGVLGEASDEIEVMPITPPIPALNVSFSIGDDSVAISWGHPDENVYFNIYRSTEKGKYPIKPLNKTPVKETSFSDFLNTDTTVYYTVRALTGSLIRDESGPSDEIKITPDDFIPSLPQGLQAIVTEKGVQLIWKENHETWVRGYRIYRAQEGGEFKNIGESQTPAFFDKQPPQGKVLYKLSGLGPTKEGLCSEIIEAQ